jgi:hypothetical protein
VGSRNAVGSIVPVSRSPVVAFRTEVSSNGFEIVAEEIAQSEVLFSAEVLTATKQQPAGLLEDRVEALTFH